MDPMDMFNPLKAHHPNNVWNPATDPIGLHEDNTVEVRSRPETTFTHERDLTPIYITLVVVAVLISAVVIRGLIRGRS